MTTWRDLVAQGVIVCPADRGRLTVGERLVCEDCGRSYPIDDDIPVLLVSDALGGDATSA